MQEQNMELIYDIQEMMNLKKAYMKSKILEYMNIHYPNEYNIIIMNPTNNNYIFNVESQYDIEPCLYNDNSTTKYEGYTVELITKKDAKKRIKDQIKELYDDGCYSIEGNEDCLDNRYNDYQKLSYNKLFNKIWNEQKYNCYNDGVIEIQNNYMILLINFYYSKFVPELH